MYLLYIMALSLGIVGTLGMEQSLTKKSIGTAVFSVAACLLAFGALALHKYLYGW